ncbi:hypothetical protein B0H13DRAFT_1920687 [Mycena leptocephala]|nr:hypothetical protein B0H13DRAFT_1920687 [Mycena leptocephala]
MFLDSSRAFQQVIGRGGLGNFKLRYKQTEGTGNKKISKSSSTDSHRKRYRSAEFRDLEDNSSNDSSEDSIPFEAVPIPIQFGRRGQRFTVLRSGRESWRRGRELEKREREREEREREEREREPEKRAREREERERELEKREREEREREPEKRAREREERERELEKREREERERELEKREREREEREREERERELEKREREREQRGRELEKRERRGRRGSESWRRGRGSGSRGRGSWRRRRKGASERTSSAIVICRGDIKNEAHVNDGEADGARRCCGGGAAISSDSIFLEKFDDGFLYQSFEQRSWGQRGRKRAFMALSIPVALHRNFNGSMYLALFYTRVWMISLIGTFGPDGGHIA